MIEDRAIQVRFLAETHDFFVNFITIIFRTLRNNPSISSDLNLLLYNAIHYNEGK